MKGKIVSLNVRSVVYAISFVLAVAATYFLLPQEDDFDRYFEVGKPWTYDELIAPKDFAIYKSDAQLGEERAKALTELEPYISVSKRDDIVVNNILSDNQRLRDWLVERLKEIFEVGVISLQDRQEMDRLGVTRVVLLEGNRVGRKVLANDLFTLKTAYDYVISRAGEVGWIDINQLRASNFEQYITANAEIDRVKTDQAMQIIVDGVMLTSGMVQHGEKIIPKLVI